MQLAVIAKEPRPGRVKTRLCPPASPEQAAAIAAASLQATLATIAAATGATRRVLVLDGRPGPWVPDGFEVIAQRGDGLDQRLTNAFADCFAVADDPVVIVGMDTPQLREAHLARASAALATAAGAPGRDQAVLGPATDGGYWLIGLTRLRRGAIDGVPMSADDTLWHQRRQLSDVGYEIAEVDELTDVDTMTDARDIAGRLPGSSFARAVAAVSSAHPKARSWRRMSRTARSVPPTVPVTFERPARAR